MLALSDFPTTIEDTSFLCFRWCARRSQLSLGDVFVKMFLFNDFHINTVDKQLLRCSYCSWHVSTTLVSVVDSLTNVHHTLVDMSTNTSVFGS